MLRMSRCITRNGEKMLRINSIKLKPDYAEADLKNSILKRLRLEKRADELLSYKLVKRSIDARDKADIKYVICVDACVKNEQNILRDKRIKDVCISEPVRYKDPFTCVSDKKETSIHPVVVGFGPAGMICAYKLALAGLRPIVIERGLDVDSRIDRVNTFWKGGELDENTNVQFGEGGAGTFSDGKLSTMIHDKIGRIGEFFKILVENGADESILYNAKPHVGTDRLAIIVKNIRNKIIELGGEVRFGCRLKGIVTDKDGRIQELIINRNYVNPVRNAPNGHNLDDQIDEIIEDKKEYSIPTNALVLAIGHSARDTFEMLHDKGFMMEQKAFAVGVRVQHPQELIGFSQYGKDYVKLPAADYKLTYQSEHLNRGVYSFCMCPGGFVVNSSSEKGRLVVNGMSNSDRSEPTANSAIVVNVDNRDFGSDSWNAGVEFQRKLEEKAFLECGGKIPVQTYENFKNLHNISLNNDRKAALDKKSITDSTFDRSDNKSNDSQASPGSIMPNTKGLWDFGNIHNILPSQLCDAILEAFPDFGRKIRGFDSPEALLMGVESRTSSPVRITRDENLEAVGFTGIYPCGEGAGYAGGITSAAIDGIKVYEAIISKI